MLAFLVEKKFDDFGRRHNTEFTRVELPGFAEDLAQDVVADAAGGLDDAFAGTGAAGATCTAAKGAVTVARQQTESNAADAGNCRRGRGRNGMCGIVDAEGNAAADRPMRFVFLHSTAREASATSNHAATIAMNSFFSQEPP